MNDRVRRVVLDRQVYWRNRDVTNNYYFYTSDFDYTGIMISEMITDDGHTFKYSVRPQGININNSFFFDEKSKRQHDYNVEFYNWAKSLSTIEIKDFIKFHFGVEEDETTGI